jgi:hypothetical protein
VKSGSDGKLENPCRGRLESADCDCSVPKSGIAGKFNPPRAELKSGRGGKSALFTLMSGSVRLTLKGRGGNSTGPEGKSAGNAREINSSPLTLNPGLDSLKLGSGGKLSGSLKFGRGGKPDCSLLLGSGGKPGCSLKFGRGGKPDCSLLLGSSGKPNCLLKFGRGGKPDCPALLGSRGTPDRSVKSGRGGNSVNGCPTTPECSMKSVGNSC